MVMTEVGQGLQMSILARYSSEKKKKKQVSCMKMTELGMDLKCLFQSGVRLEKSIRASGFENPV